MVFQQQQEQITRLAKRKEKKEIFVQGEAL
jgi:hypothetical protein